MVSTETESRGNPEKLLLNPALVLTFSLPHLPLIGICTLAVCVLDCFPAHPLQLQLGACLGWWWWIFLFRTPCAYLCQI